MSEKADQVKEWHGGAEEIKEASQDEDEKTSKLSFFT